MKLITVLRISLSISALSLMACHAPKPEQQENLPETVNNLDSEIGSGKFVDDRAATKQAFLVNYKKWQEANLTDYSIVFQRSCFCPQEFVQPLQLKIVDSQVVVVKNLDAKAVSKQVSESAKTVSQVFATIEKSLTKAENITVSYDEQYGYPKELFIDRSRRMADEEVRISFKEIKL